MAGDEGEGVGDGEELQGTEEKGKEATDGEADDGAAAAAEEPESGDKDEAVEGDLGKASQEREGDGETGEGGFARRPVAAWRAAKRRTRGSQTAVVIIDWWPLWPVRKPVARKQSPPKNDEV